MLRQFKCNYISIAELEIVMNSNDFLCEFEDGTNLETIFNGKFTGDK